jgi:hypothetical protein
VPYSSLLCTDTEIARRLPAAGSPEGVVPRRKPPPSVEAVDIRHATLFVALLGLLNLFVDMTYESARSIAGPFLQILGASALVVGVVAGFGELRGYALRFSGCVPLPGAARSGGAGGGSPRLRAAFLALSRGDRLRRRRVRRLSAARIPLPEGGQRAFTMDQPLWAQRVQELGVGPSRSRAAS